MVKNDREIAKGGHETTTRRTRRMFDVCCFETHTHQLSVSDCKPRMNARKKGKRRTRVALRESPLLLLVHILAKAVQRASERAAARLVLVRHDSGSLTRMRFTCTFLHSDKAHELAQKAQCKLFLANVLLARGAPVCCPSKFIAH